MHELAITQSMLDIVLEQAEKAGSDFVPDLTPSVRSTILAQPGIIARTIIEVAAAVICI